MYRIILFLLFILIAAGCAAWVADQPGEVLMVWGGWSAHPSLPVFVMLVGIVIVAAILVWSILRALWRTPHKIRRRRRERHVARGRHAITQGLLAIGHGDSNAARAHADVARRHAADDPLALLLHAQSGATRRRSRRRADGVSRHGRTQGLQGYWACAGCSSRPSAPTIRSPRSWSPRKR